jgi:hypothetical protein
MDPVTSAPPSRAHEAGSVAALLVEARKRLIETGTRNRLVHTNRKGCVSENSPARRWC